MEFCKASNKHLKYYILNKNQLEVFQLSKFYKYMNKTN